MNRDDLTTGQRRWLEHIEACAASGGSMKAYAEAHGLALASFYFWKGRLKKLGVVPAVSSTADADAMAPVAVAALPHARPSARILLSNGIAIEVPGDVGADVLARIVKAASA